MREELILKYGTPPFHKLVKCFGIKEAECMGRYNIIAFTNESTVVAEEPRNGRLSQLSALWPTRRWEVSFHQTAGRAGLTLHRCLRYSYAALVINLFAF